MSAAEPVYEEKVMPRNNALPPLPPSPDTQTTTVDEEEAERLKAEKREKKRRKKEKKRRQRELEAGETNEGLDTSGGLEESEESRLEPQGSTVALQENVVPVENL